MPKKHIASICPYCGYINYYRIRKGLLSKMSEFLIKDIKWDGMMHCVNCTRNYKVT